MAKSVKRKYTKRNTAYWSNTQQFKDRYKSLETYRKAQGVGSKEYQEYVKQYYKVSKSLRKGKVSIGETKSQLLTEKQYNINMKSIKKMSTGKLVAKQFGLLTGNTARKLAETLLVEGSESKLTLQQIATKQFSAKDWGIIDEYYHNMKAQGLTAKAAQLEVSSYFFGS